VQFLFAEHALDVERRELRRRDALIAIEPQVFDLLLYLVRNRDRVVSKDDLIEADGTPEGCNGSTTCNGPPRPRKLPRTDAAAATEQATFTATHRAARAHESAKVYVKSGPARRMPVMLDRTDLEPLFFAPFVSSVMRIEPAWIDYNGHLNSACRKTAR